jgi:hypothetical protein
VGARAFMASHAHVMWAVGGQCMIVVVLAVAIGTAMAAVITFVKNIHRDAESCKWMCMHVSSSSRPSFFVRISVFFTFFIGLEKIDKVVGLVNVGTGGGWTNIVNLLECYVSCHDIMNTTFLALKECEQIFSYLIIKTNYYNLYGITKSCVVECSIIIHTNDSFTL